MPDNHRAKVGYPMQSCSFVCDTFVLRILFQEHKKSPLFDRLKTDPSVVK
jgi:hypothetical protein